MVRGRGLSRSQDENKKRPSYARGSTSSRETPLPLTDSNTVVAAALDDSSNITSGTRGSELNNSSPSGPYSCRIRKIFEERLDAEGSCWKVSTGTKKFYFKEFKKYFMWTKGNTDAVVQDAWEKQAGTRYRDMISDIKGKATKPAFITDVVWESWQADWRDPEYVRVVQQNSMNRRSEVNGFGVGLSRHTGGSLSHVQHRK